MKRVFKYKKGECIDGTEAIYDHIFNLIQDDNCRCPKDIKITILSETSQKTNKEKQK